MINFIRIFLFSCILLLGSCANTKISLANSEQLTNNESKTAIVFVHGFMGDHKNTWLNSESKAYWPELMAKDTDLKSYDIFVINYYSELFGNRFTLSELGIWFNAELKNIGVIGSNKYENIIFIAHSMGNLVVRAGIYEDNSKFNNLKIPLILSFGSPSEGSDFAVIGNIFFPNNQSFSNLSIFNNNYLTTLNEKWLISKGDTKISCAYEKISYGNLGLIVDEKSATKICTGTKWPVISDHIAMVKPKNPQDRTYVWTKNEILDSLKSPLLQNKINFKNLYSTNNNERVTVLNSQQPLKAGMIPYESLADIKRSISTMYTSDVDKFLIKTIPQIQGGITCDDFVDMLKNAYTAQGAIVVKKVAPYIRRPFKDNCFAKIGSLIYSSDAAGAISDLLSSEIKY